MNYFPGKTTERSPDKKTAEESNETADAARRG
jgi:hypothetical protein